MKRCIKSVGVALLVATCFGGGVHAQDTIPFSLTLAHPLSTGKTAESVVGFDVALINSRIDVLRGVSFAGIVSNVESSMHGFQASSIVNVAPANAVGYQTVGIVNVAKGNFTGMQNAGLLNITKGKMMGLQAGFINVSENMYGVQAGFINIAEHMHGVPFGIINIAENGTQSAIAYTSNFSGINLGAKFVVNNFHSVITIGGMDFGEDYDNAGSYSTFWGYHLPIGPAYVELDVGTMYLANIDTWEDDTPEVRQLNVVRLGAGWNITPWLGVFGGVGPGSEVKNDNWEDAEFKLLTFGGITLFQ